ncbi:putative protein AF-9 [Trypanosoma rangeli]|uniref:YEATS domain-containing protein n=1 Tax=Trypanosoma rangeli TaxID=5698 RepID=A0A3R7MB98_TRYRA|nr:putative protein AF-9 [Trypanosoma rangeli]RNF02779.1 putative protein AF-9 [Trypanosoma rangeli]|eukprot:RNF02779.1 putative protein AF-9 [Trypanosoma rangeli]
MTVFTRVFTIHFDGNVYEASADCRVTRTLRELLLATLPPPPPPPPLRHAASWVEGYTCSFGGQRLSLAAATEVAPTTLYVTLPARSGTGGKAAASRSAGSLKRRRPNSPGKGESSATEGGNDGKENNNNNNGSDSTSSGDSNDESGEDVFRSHRQPYWRPRAAQSNSSKNNTNNSSNYEEEDEDEDEEEGDEEEKQDMYKSCSSSIAMWQDKADSDGSNDDVSSCDDRQQEAVLPIIVGGVVRLINIESRDRSHQWTVYIRGLFNETEYLAQCIESVRFILDPSFAPSERVVRTAPFELTEVGWGEFVVKMQVQLRHYPRPIRVMLSSSSFASAANCESEIKVASNFLASQPMVPLSGLTRGPILSPVVQVLSQHRYHGGTAVMSPTSTVAAVSGSSRRGVVKTEVKVEKEDSSSDTNSKFRKDNVRPSEVRSPGQPTLATLEMSPGVVTLSHLLRFSHRPRRAHCIPPLGRPYEPEEHVGYTIVQTPVVTEQYDEIVVPDPPAPILEVAEALPRMLRRRIATVKTARAMAQLPQQQQRLLASGGAPFGVAAAFTDNGVSCWEYILQEEPDDAVLAESYLESVGETVLSPAGAQHPSIDALVSPPCADTQRQEHEQPPPPAFYGIESPVVVKLPRGRRKLAGAEIDLAALKTAKKGLVEAIEKMRRELVLRQAAQTYQHYR